MLIMFGIIRYTTIYGNDKIKSFKIRTNKNEHNLEFHEMCFFMLMSLWQKIEQTISYYSITI